MIISNVTKTREFAFSLFIRSPGVLLCYHDDVSILLLKKYKYIRVTCYLNNILLLSLRYVSVDTILSILQALVELELLPVPLKLFYHFRFESKVRYTNRYKL